MRARPQSAAMKKPSRAPKRQPHRHASDPHLMREEREVRELVDGRVGETAQQLSRMRPLDLHAGELGRDESERYVQPLGGFGVGCCVAGCLPAGTSRKPHQRVAVEENVVNY